MNRDQLKASRLALVEILAEAGTQVGQGGECRCPFHDDQRASAGIFKANECWLFKCQPCGIAGDIFQMTERIKGISVLDQLKGLSGEPAKQKPIYPTLEALKKSVPNLQDTFIYSHPDTKEPELIILRHLDASGHKSFKNARPVQGGFVKEAPPKPWPLYNRRRLREAKKIVVVEGEKCVHSIQDAMQTDKALVATTSPGGAGKASYCNWEPLAGKQVVLWPDNDKAGLNHMKQVADALARLQPVPSVSWLDPGELGLGEKEDAADYLARQPENQRKPALHAAISLASSMGASDGLRGLLGDTISGKRRAIPWPWRCLTALSKDLLNGSTLAVCGEPGSSKTFFVLECAAFWHATGVKVAMFELEDDRELYLLRMLAQIENNADLCDDAWIRANPESSLAAYDKHKDFLDSMARIITVPDDEVDHAYVLNWAKQQIKAGAEILIIDPVTAIGGSTKDTSENDRRFVKSLNQLGKESGTRNLLVTHPKKLRPGQPVTLDDMAGGTAYARFTHGVFWIKRHDPKDASIIGPYGMPTTCSIDRTLSLFKGRNGKGTGSDIGFCFDKRSLRFAEAGVISKGGASGAGTRDPFQTNEEPESEELIPF